EIREKLVAVLERFFDGVNLDDIEVEVTVAPEAAGADYASNVAMKLAGKVGRAPREVAAELAEALRTEGMEVNIAGPGFLNFILSNEYYSGKLAEIDKNLTNLGKNITCGEYDSDGDITQNEYLGKTVVAEFSDPNPFKVLHVGHLYTSVVGDAMARMMEFAGARVVRANFGGDVGLHVAKNMYAILRNVEKLAEVKEAGVDKIAEFLGKCYVEGTRAYEDDEAAHAEITRLNRILFEISAAGPDYEWEDAEKAKIAEIYWWGREASYRYFDEFYARLGVKFDKYYPESAVAKRGLEKVREQLAAGVYEESDGAVIFPGEKYDLHTRVFINKEGLPTYEAKDVGLIFQKWDDWKFDKSIVITGNEQNEYMKVVLKSVEQYAPELVERTVHLTHGMVRLPGDAKMSSRLGNFVKAVDVLDIIEGLLEKSYGKVDELVALGAVKYAFLKSRVGGNIIFDAEESVSMTGNSGPYLQYSCVRAKRILTKLTSLDSSALADARFALRTSSTVRSSAPAALNSSSEDNFEKQLVKKIIQYPGVLAGAVGELAPHKLCNYLYELAQEFSRFYEKVAVVGSEREAERGRLVQIYNNIMT
ncbi:arginine--tRNA ligase, partial [Candidatus Saccharibacteria bacterium]|nr:arginine--tRNA ligase [Candidatus Saccharibacteria bacterium]